VRAPAAGLVDVEASILGLDEPVVDEARSALARATTDFARTTTDFARATKDFARAKRECESGANQRSNAPRTPKVSHWWSALSSLGTSSVLSVSFAPVPETFMLCEEYRPTAKLRNGPTASFGITL
jgi:hypothetical protein